jgi:hydrogenase nickel incorporation protein HypB
MSTVDIKKKILAKNDEIAEELRLLFKEKNIAVFNFVSSPGSGKTSILEKTLVKLKEKYNICVIEGDLQTDNDAKRIEAVGVKAIQINTGRACHLEASSIKKVVNKLNTENIDLIVIENVGNLVCPSAYDLGEDCKIVIISTTEGDDKPSKYPTMVYVSSALIINKTDLLPYVNFDVEKCIQNAKKVKPSIKCFQTSCVKENGFDEWLSWFEEKIKEKLCK